MRNRSSVAFLLALALSSPAMAQDGAAEENPNGRKLSLSVAGGGMVNLTGDADTTITPEAFVEVDGPLAVGKSAVGRAYTRLGITSLPGETVDPTDVTTFRAAEVDLGIYRILGELKVGNQHVTTAAIGEWGFSSILPSAGADPQKRLIRHYGGGIRFDELSSGAELQFLYGRDEAAGARGWGQWLIYGQVPLVGTNGIVLLVGEASLSVGKPQVVDAIPGESPAVLEPQRDLLRLGVTVDLARTIELLHK